MVDRVALFVTCLADTLFPQVGQAYSLGLQVTITSLFGPRLAIVLHPVPSGL